METKIEKTTDNVRGWRVGDRVSTFEGRAFNTAVILGFECVGGSWYARLARPYCYAHDLGTSCATPLLGVEIYAASLDFLRETEKSDPSRPAPTLLADDFVNQYRKDRA